MANALIEEHVFGVAAENIATRSRCGHGDDENKGEK